MCLYDTGIKRIHFRNGLFHYSSRLLQVYFVLTSRTSHVLYLLQAECIKRLILTRPSLPLNNKSITYNWMCSILPLKSMPHIIFSPLSMNKISNKNIFYDEFGDYLVHFYCFHAYMYHSFPNSHILINSFEQNYLYLF